jgi:hypothetical protein
VGPVGKEKFLPLPGQELRPLGRPAEIRSLLEEIQMEVRMELFRRYSKVWSFVITKDDTVRGLPVKEVSGKSAFVVIGFTHYINKPIACTVSSCIVLTLDIS